jgi:hypothetical protein
LISYFQQKYHDRAADLLKEYHITYEEWCRTITPELLRKINKQRRLKKKPRIHLRGHTDSVKPLNPYLIFLSDQRALAETWEGAPPPGRARQSWFVKKTAEQWQKLSAEEKAVRSR